MLWIKRQLYWFRTYPLLIPVVVILPITWVAVGVGMFDGLAFLIGTTISVAH